ncbi:MAG: alkaline phosphatase family protein, partial [Myxococcota bacterium]
VCNHWYSSVLGPTWPNRFYLHGGTADGRTGNLPLTGFRSIFDLLDEGGISHSNYFHDVAFATGGYFKLSGLDGIETYFEHAAAGTLPQVCVIDPKFFGQGANDDHPDHDVRLGQALIASVFRALAESPQWSRSLFVLTYDEHGGFYDHVAPPQTQDERVDFRQLGFRVPSLVAGPTVRHGCAIDETLDHTSVVATLTRRFGLDILNDRVAVTRDLSLCIDPELIDNPRPAPELPVLDISRRAIAERPAAATHGEIAQVVNAMRLPRHLDRRGRDMEISNLWLERAARLGAVHLID